MILYQLFAKGSLAEFGGSNVIVSQRIFSKKENAITEIPRFRKRVTTPKNEYDLSYLQDNSMLRISIHELELVDLG